MASSAIDNRTGIITSLARTVTDGRPIPAASTSSQPALGRMSQGPRSLEAITEPVPFHLLANVMCRPPRRSSVPDGLTILGDSQSSLNLIYGHGTTLAALGHRPFRTTLLVRASSDHNNCNVASPRPPPAPGSRSSVPAALPGVPAQPSLSRRIIGRYVRRVHAAASSDSRPAVAFTRLAGRVDDQGASLRLSIVRRTLAATPNPTT